MAETGTQQETERPKDEAPSYPRERCIEESGALVGQPSHVVAAALSMGRNATKKNFTQAEVERAVKDFHDHEVEIDHPGQEG